MKVSTLPPPPGPFPHIDGGGEQYSSHVNLFSLSLSAWRWTAAILVLLLAVLGTRAQDAVDSDNAMIAIAEQMYCPVCENIPLDECQTSACLEWKEEIRQQLAAGRDEAEIIESFVRRFGDQVVGVPQDPVLRWLTILVPTLALIVAVGLGIHTFRRFGAHQRLQVSVEPLSESARSDEDYRRRLEEDILARR